MFQGGGGFQPPIDVICARCSAPFYTALAFYLMGPPPTPPPCIAHAHDLFLNSRSMALYGGRGAVCNGCHATIGDHPSYGCAACAFDLCFSCARPPLKNVAACLQTNALPHAGVLRPGAGGAATWDCAACSRVIGAATAWTFDTGSGAVPISVGFNVAVAIGEGEARIVAHSRAIVPRAVAAVAPVFGLLGSSSGSTGLGGPFEGPGPTRALPPGSFVMGKPAMHHAALVRADAAAVSLRASDLHFDVRCRKALGDLEDLGDGVRFHCTDCDHTVTCVDTWGKYEALAKEGGRCIAARIIDPENGTLVRATAVRG
jgi:hypothetical protein